jgi:acetylornithine deacetylase
MKGHGMGERALKRALRKEVGIGHMRKIAKEKIIRQVEKSFDEQLQFLSRLVSFKSLSGQEGEAQIFFAQACRDLRLDVEMFEGDKTAIRLHPAYNESGMDWAGRPNVIARFKGVGKGRSLILNGHMDVVPPDPISSWSMDPWRAEVKGDRLYGRGALDMKGGLSANLFALQAISAANLRPEGEVILESTIEEEAGGGGGTLACFIHGVKADGMVIPNCTQENVWVTHSGVKWFRVKVLGRAAHGGLSHEGVNAIYKMVPIIRAIEKLDYSRAKAHSYPLLEKQIGRPCNLCVGKIIAGDWPTMVPGSAVLEGRIGFVPGETGPQVMGELEKAVADSVSEDEWCQKHPPQIEWFGINSDPWTEPEESLLVKRIIGESQKILGHKPEIGGFTGVLDTRFGPFFDTPTVSFGPKGGNPHGVDEYLNIPSLLAVTKILALLITDWCGLSG